MGGTLTQQRHVWEEAFRCVNHALKGITEDFGLYECTFSGSTGKLRASSRGNTRGASVVRNHWAQRERRRSDKRSVQCRGLTPDLQTGLPFLSRSEAGGIPGVAVECVDIRKNTDGEGSQLGTY